MPALLELAMPMRFTPEDYCELLGLYLGDGCISHHQRSDRLRTTLDAKYPSIIEQTRDLVARCFFANAVDVVPSSKGSCVQVAVYSRHLMCLFPQHGPGAKHKRRIALEDWQSRLLSREPWGFVRGCIRSDGSAFINRTDVHRPQPYEYLSYEFSNTSEEMARLFVRACDLLFLRPRITCDKRGRWKVRINRRESVARMLEHVGLKT